MRPSVDSRANFGQSGGFIMNHASTNASTLQELSSLAQRMDALQTGMIGLRQEMQANRRPSMPDLASAGTRFSQQTGTGQSPTQPFQPSASVVHATMAAQQAAFGQSRPITPASATYVNDAFMAIDPETMLRNGRRARAATWPISSGVCTT